MGLLWRSNALKNIIPLEGIANLVRKFLTILLRKRSHQALNPHSVKRIDTNEQMRIIKEGQDNMIEFIRIVPDECLIDLSDKVYCRG